MNERIKHLVDSLGIKRSEFARRLNLSQPFVSELCSGKNNPSDRTIVDICREFRVSEQWLRTGEGEMFLQLDKDAEFDMICAEMQLSNDVFIKQILRNYWKLEENEKAVIRKLISGL